MKKAGKCAMRHETIVDAMIRACLLMLVDNGSIVSEGSLPTWQNPLSEPQTINIGSMKDEINMPDNFDEVFDSLDGETASTFSGF